MQSGDPLILFLKVSNDYVEEDQGNDYQDGAAYTRNHFRLLPRKNVSGWVNQKKISGGALQIVSRRVG